MYEELRVVEALTEGLSTDLGSREDGNRKENQIKTKMSSSISPHYLSRPVIPQWDHGNTLGSMVEEGSDKACSPSAMPGRLFGAHQE